jgi:hypothetical protein
MARRAGGVTRDDFAQAAKFEEFFGGAAHQFKMRERARSVKLIEKGKTKFEKRNSKNFSPLATARSLRKRS